MKKDILIVMNKYIYIYSVNFVYNAQRMIIFFDINLLHHIYIYKV